MNEGRKQGERKQGENKDEERMRESEERGNEGINKVRVCWREKAKTYRIGGEIKEGRKRT